MQAYHSTNLERLKILCKHTIKSFFTLEPSGFGSCLSKAYICNIIVYSLMEQKRVLPTQTWHKAGLWLSILCTIHCLAMPFIMALLPFLGSFISHEFEHILVNVSVVLAFVLLIKDYRMHRMILPLLLVGVATVLNFLGLYVVDHDLETYFVVPGALVMASAYYVNWRYHSRVCPH